MIHAILWEGMTVTFDHRIFIRIILNVYSLKLSTSKYSIQINSIDTT